MECEWEEAQVWSKQLTIDSNRKAGFRQEYFWIEYKLYVITWLYLCVADYFHSGVSLLLFTLTMEIVRFCWVFFFPSFLGRWRLCAFSCYFDKGGVCIYVTLYFDNRRVYACKLQFILSMEMVYLYISAYFDSADGAAHLSATGRAQLARFDALLQSGQDDGPCAANGHQEPTDPAGTLCSVAIFVSPRVQRCKLSSVCWNLALRLLTYSSFSVLRDRGVQIRTINLKLTYCSVGVCGFLFVCLFFTF